jgi:hypothetical protein
LESTFDDLEEQTSIDEEVHHVFFHQFISWSSTMLYKRYIVILTDAEEAELPEMNEAGMPGCVGSMDATHVACEKVAYGQ